MVDSVEIHKKLEYYKNTLYSTVRNEQRTDEEFYKDEFPVPWIKKPLVVSRTGAAAELIDVPVAQLASSSLKVYRPALKETSSAKGSAVNISKYLNQTALRQIMKQNPNPKLEYYKNQFLRGEAWIQVMHNQTWVTGEKKSGLPFHLLLRDPMIVYASPNEDQDGIPEEAFIFYDRMPWIVQVLYPAWSNPKHAGTGESGSKQNVGWMEYWTPDTRYFEADGESVLLDPDSRNPYGFVPLVHKIASFGKSSEAGQMQDLIVSRIRKYRDLLRRNAAMTSDVDSMYHLYANPSQDVQPIDPEIHIPENFAKKYVFGPGHTNEIPYGIEIKRGIDLMPSMPEVLQWNYAIEAQLGRKIPGALMGMPQGASGRLQDMTYTAAMQSYSIEQANLENAFATAFSMALRIMDEWPGDGLIPEGMSKDDIGGNYDVVCELKVDDPMYRDRKINAGRTEVVAGMRSLKTYLMKDRDMTEDEADEEIDQILAEKYMFQSPDIAELMQVRAAEKSGMMGDMQALKARRQELEKKIKQFPLGAQIGSQGGEPRIGNVQTELGQEMSDVGMTTSGLRSTRQV
jgi:hypothetical protein